MYKKFLKSVLLLFLFFLFSSSTTHAFQNNIFGIHITHKEDLKKATELVNSGAGDWGYVTVVIRDNEKNSGYWQEFFNLAREKHLIPLVRLATHLDGDAWIKPRLEDLANWPEFLDSLNWPIKQRYIIVYNEPNHDKEWGNDANPREYAQILEKAVKVFKQKNPDFQILNAGLDQAAANYKETIDELDFLKQMSAEIPEIFNQLDGWTSHSYPNHGYLGKPWETGKATIRGYLWELEVLKNLGTTKDLPIFITETGWLNTTTADYIKYAYENIWLPDSRVMAITPFILNYPQAPFSQFSWLDENGQSYQQYETVKTLSKIKGTPEQIEKYEIVNDHLPSVLPPNFSYQGKINLKNTGQSIWGEKEFKLSASSSSNLIKITDLILPTGILVKPSEQFNFEFTVETGSRGGDYQFSWKDLPTHKLHIFSFGSLTPNKNSFLNQFWQRLLSFFFNR